MLFSKLNEYFFFKWLMQSHQKEHYKSLVLVKRRILGGLCFTLRFPRYCDVNRVFFIVRFVLKPFKVLTFIYNAVSNPLKIFSSINEALNNKYQAQSTTRKCFERFSFLVTTLYRYWWITFLFSSFTSLKLRLGDSKVVVPFYKMFVRILHHVLDVDFSHS